jgi:uncharacterized membrane protein
MPISDLISVILMVFLSLLGYSRGFLRSIFGPLALVIATVVSFVYWVWTKDLVVSLCIGLVGPFLLTWIFKFLLNSFKKATNPEAKPNFISSLLGMALTLGWGMVMWLMAVFLVSIIPPIFAPMEMITKDIHQSATYRLIKPFDFTASKRSATDPNEKPKSAEEDLADLSEDQRIKDLLNDPEMIKAIEKKDYAALMKSPQILAIAQDPQLVKKMLSLYKKMADEGTLPK